METKDVAKRIQVSQEERKWALLVVKFLLSLALACVPAIVSITNPFRESTSPMFMPPAVRNMAMVTLVVVPVMWLFGHKWSQALLQKIFFAGVILCTLAVVSVLFASFLTVQQAGPLLVTVEISGSFAIPCISVFGLLKHKVSK